MPLPIITDTWRAAIELKAPGARDPVINVVHINSAATDSATFNADFCDAWATNTAPYLQSDWIWQPITWTKLDGSASVVQVWGSTTAGGGDTTHAIGLNSAACWGWRTPVAGRSNRGRSYLGPITVASLSATKPDLLETAPLAAMQASADALVADLITADIPLVVASYTLASARQVTSTKVNPNVCTQRRRVNQR
jgi:hypothetical protein